MDYVTALLKQGFPPEHVKDANNLWRACGLTRIRFGERYYTLRFLEEV